MTDQSYRRTLAASNLAGFIQSATMNLSPFLFVPLMLLYGLSYTQLGTLVLINFVAQFAADLYFGWPVNKHGYKPFCIGSQLAIVVGSRAVRVRSVDRSRARDDRVRDRDGHLLRRRGTARGAALADHQVDPGREQRSQLHDHAQLVRRRHLRGRFGHDGAPARPRQREVAARRAALGAAAPLQRRPVHEVPHAADRGRTPADEDRHVAEAPGLHRRLLRDLLRRRDRLLIVQWGSTYLEEGLGLSKTLGDVVGLCLFSAMLAVARLLYAWKGRALNMNNLMIWGSLACVMLYVVVALVPAPWLVMVAFALIGFCSSMLWTGTLIVAADSLPYTGALIFALLAGGGDLGIAVVGQLVGWLSDFFGARPPPARTRLSMACRPRCWWRSRAGAVAGLPSAAEATGSAPAASGARDGRRQV